MIEKFDQNKKSLLISVFISILIIFFNLEIGKIDFFEKISIPKKLEVYFILIVNSYFYYEIFTSWLLLELEKELYKKIYKVHFIISTTAYFAIILIVIAKSINTNPTINYLIFGFLTFILFNCLYSLFYNIRKLIISINYNKHESIFNVFHILINSSLTIFILFKLNDSILEKVNIINYIIAFIILSITSYLHINFMVNHKYFKKYNNRLLYFTQLKNFSPTIKEFTENKSTEEIQKDIKDISSEIVKIKDIPLENKIASYINSGNIDSVKKIIRENKQLNINCRRYNGWTFLHDSVSQGEYEITKFLLENGSETDIKNEMGLYPINFAVNYNNIEILKLLIDYHANIEIKDCFGFPPIYSAISSDNLEIIKLLIKNGGKFKQKNKGITPLEFAKRERKGKIAKYLKSLNK